MSKNFAIVCIVGIAVYTNSLGNGFHYDDEHSILRNPSIRDPLNIPAFFIDTSFSIGILFVLLIGKIKTHLLISI